MGVYINPAIIDDFITHIHNVLNTFSMQAFPNLTRERIKTLQEFTSNTLLPSLTSLKLKDTFIQFSSDLSENCLTDETYEIGKKVTNARVKTAEQMFRFEIGVLAETLLEDFKELETFTPVLELQQLGQT